MKQRLLPVIVPIGLILSSFVPPTPARNFHPGGLDITGIRLTTEVREQDGFASGVLQLRVLFSEKPAAPLPITIRVMDGQHPVLTKTVLVTDSASAFTLTLPHPKLWSAEQPNRYTVEIRLPDANSTALKPGAGPAGTKPAPVPHTPTPAKISMVSAAFRSLHLRQGQLQVNGHPTPLRGICLPDAPATAGAIRSVAGGATEPATRGNGYTAMLNTIRLLKQYNINTVTRSPWTGDSTWYELCDQHGIYLPEKAPPTSNQSASLTQPADHPCIILADSSDMPAAVPCLPELFGSSGQPNPAALELRYHYQNIQTSLSGPLPAWTVPSGPAPSGIVRTRQTASPAGPAPTTVPVRITNEYAGWDLSGMILHWDLLCDGYVRQSGNQPLPHIAPGQTLPVRLPVGLPPGKPKEVLLNIRYQLRKETSLLPAGFVTAREQLMLKRAAAGPEEVRPDGELTFKDEDNLFTISSPQTLLQFDKQNGWLRTYTFKGNALLDDTLGLHANFWHPPSGQEYGTDLPKLLYPWKNAGRDARLQLFSTSTASDFVIVKADYELSSTFSTLHIRYTINAKGVLHIEQVMETDSLQKIPPMPRFGMQWFLPPGYDSVSWYGYGPQETGPDQTMGTELGIYRKTVEELTDSSWHSCAAGLRSGVRWWKITNRQGSGLLLLADSSGLLISASRYFDKDLDHTEEPILRNASLPAPHPGTQLNLDYRLMTCGNKDVLSGQANPARPLPGNNYSFSFTVIPQTP